jgi:hypothetical protein
MRWHPILLWQICNICWTDESAFATMRTGRWPLRVGTKGEKFMALQTGRSTRSSVRALVRATACSVMVLAALVLFGTAGVLSPAIAQVKAPTKSKLKPPAKADPTDGVADQLNAKWLQENGQYAGTSPRTGFDCSGFVYYLYGATFGQSIPRMPHDMAREGMPVARSDLKRGDLVFFGHRGTFTHVGIYAGNDQFVHATQRGRPVQVTPLDADYFRDRYMTAVRLSPR